jgi:hypothetical protein
MLFEFLGFRTFTINQTLVIHPRNSRSNHRVLSKHLMHSRLLKPFPLNHQMMLKTPLTDFKLIGMNSLLYPFYFLGYFVHRQDVVISYPNFIFVFPSKSNFIMYFISRKYLTLILAFHYILSEFAQKVLSLCVERFIYVTFQLCKVIDYWL